MAFECWSDALPYALHIARKFGNACPLGIDAESVAMEALWRAQCAGAVFTKAYVVQRVSGALKDEMRKLGHGTRKSGYLAVDAFSDLADAYWLADDSVDIEAHADRRTQIARMSSASRHIVREVARGKELQAIGADLGVTGARMSQVVAELRSDPSRLRKLPGTTDFYGELRAVRDSRVREALSRSKSMRSAALSIGASDVSFLNWASARGGRVNLRAGQGSGVRQAMMERACSLVRAGFAKANGSPSRAAVFLNVSVMTAWRWGRFVGVARDNRKRTAVTESECAHLRADGLSHRQIAERLGCPREMVTRRLAKVRRLAARNEGA